MAEKVEGATNKCGSCGELTVCRKITYEGKEKLQWQNHDDSNAHYGFDFKTKKSWCKKTPKVEQEEPKGTDIEKPIKSTSLYSESLRKVYDAHKTELEYPEIIRIYIKVLHDCEIMGIMEPQVIGMMFNNTIRRLQ